jgi:hypothetical protein
VKRKPKLPKGPLVRIKSTGRVDKKELKIEREFAPDPKAQLAALKIALEDE